MAKDNFDKFLDDVKRDFRIHKEWLKTEKRIIELNEEMGESEKTSKLIQATSEFNRKMFDSINRANKRYFG